MKTYCGLAVAALLILCFVGVLPALWPKVTFRALRASADLTPNGYAVSEGAASPIQSFAPGLESQHSHTSSQRNTSEPVLSLREALAKPFTFWGRVIDQDKNPIPGASVTWNANDNPNPYGNGTTGRTKSDADGMFSIMSKGIGVYVKASKQGYRSVRHVPGVRPGSDGSFKNVAPVGNTDRPIGSRQTPAIFVLRKSKPAALVRVESSASVPKNGTPVLIDLKTGEVGAGQLKVQSWTEDQGFDQTVYNPYDWKCQFSVVGGGLIEGTDDLEFIAPTEGYLETAVINMPKAAMPWRPQVCKQYFVKLSDGTYGWLQIRLVTGADNYVRLESYINPVLGDRNLEYDPQATVQE